MSCLRLPPASRFAERGEEGFSLIEVIMASVVILIAIASVAFVSTQSLADVSFAKQRQGADDLVDKTLEQVRALQFSTVQAGLDPSNDATFSSDPITASGSYGGQTILVASRTSGYSQVPLVPHQQKVAITANTYTVDVYPTTYNGSHAIVEVTVVVSWANPERHGVANSVTGQTLVYSPGAGCLAATDHLFNAPCQAFYYAKATSGRGIVSIGPASGDTSALGSMLKTAELLSPTANVNVQVEQTASVSTDATTSGVVVNTGSGPTTYGAQSASSFADNDPGATSGAYQTSSVGPATSAGTTVTAADGSALSLSSSSSDTASATSASAAGATQSCTDLAGNAVATGLPCGDASAATGSGSSTATLTMPAASNTVSAALASMSDNVSSFAAQGPGPSGATTFCTAAPVAGCVHAGVSRANENLTVGSLPTNAGTALYSLAGWTGSFLKVTGSNQVAAESGTSPGSPSATSSTSVSVYSSALSGYVALNPSQSYSLALPAVAVGTDTVSGSMQLANMSLGSTNSTSSGCATSCVATSSSPVTGDLIYTMTVNNPALNTVTTVSLDVHINLGTISAQTTYQAPPSA